MGFWGDLGKELGKAAIEGVVEGINNSRRTSQVQRQQQTSQFYAQNENAMLQAAKSGDIEAISTLAVMYFSQGDHRKAGYWARKGAGVNEEACLYILGEIAFQQENYAEAERWFTRNINANGNADSAVVLGNMYCLGEDYDNAAGYFQFALRQNRNHPEASLGLANCMLEGDPEDIDLNTLKQLLQNATRSEHAQVRDSARQILNEIRDSENRANYNNNSNNNDCFITTAVCESFDKPDDCFELTAFRNFRDTWLVKQSDGKSLIAEYYSVAPKIVANINKLPNAEDIYKKIWLNYLSPCLEFIKRGDNPACKNKYVEMVKSLRKIYF